MTNQEILLVYDADCPVCDAYCRAVRANEPRGNLRLVNAREDTAVMAEVTQQGLDIDEGMVVKADGVLYYGAEAIHVLARMSHAPGAFNVMNRWIFGLPSRSRLRYPLLRSGRNLVLKALRRTRINNLQVPGNGRF